MEVLKLIYEIRYSKMLNFKDFYKEIINPYFIYPNTKYAIANEGSHQESIRLVFADSNFLIVFTLDRIHFQFDCSLNELEPKINHVEICYDILKKVREKDTFTKVNQEVLDIIFFKEIDKSRKEILEEFNRSYNLNKFDYSPTDSGIVLDKIDGKLNEKFQFGPFHFLNDKINHELFNLNHKRLSEYEKKNGLIIKCVLSKENPTDISIKSLNSLYKKAKDIFELISKNHE